MITLKQYTNEQNQILPLIQGFWKVHSNYAQSEAEAQEDLYNWTKPGHVIYFIRNDETNVGFAHLGSRGGKIDWLEELSFCRNTKEKALAVKRSSVGRNCEEIFRFTLY